MISSIQAWLPHTYLGGDSQVTIPLQFRFERVEVLLTRIVVRAAEELRSILFGGGHSHVQYVVFQQIQSGLCRFQV
ncbi:hypothetical protein NITLEN_150004 [Nitrospira lenta]|uniref:Uncharacterized protein n=1 Tax=Nitrospira lenta TaxID=1436998 RepID=A0A330L3T3_9BACT|nr:hypothetical protein NITLEN_150004 [Nitrospira lenta]